MTLFVHNLYQTIVQANARRFSNVRVITGYSSASFLLRVLKDCPNLKMDIYLGMALQGISAKDHELYKQLTESGKIRLWYVCEEPMVHQKVVDFYNDHNHQSYIGSANFSERGFLSQTEVMTVVNNSVDAIFSAIKERAYLCTSPVVEEYLRFSNTTEVSFESEQREEDVSSEVTEDKEGFSSYEHRTVNNGSEQSWRKPVGTYIKGLSLNVEGIKIPIIRPDFRENFALNASDPFLSLKGVDMHELREAERFNVQINGKDDEAIVTNFSELRLARFNIRDEVLAMLNLHDNEKVTLENAGDGVIVVQANKKAAKDRPKRYNLYLIK